MAYQVDSATGDLVINGFEKGIGDSPYSGLTDMRNMNIISVPGEASVNFSTSNIASGAATGSIVSASGTIATFSGTTGTLENYTSIYFTGTGSYSGFTTATPYWIGGLTNNTFTIYSDYAKTTAITITGSGTAAFKAYQMGFYPSFVFGGVFAGGIQHFAQPRDTSLGYYTFGVDSAGLVWGNLHTTGTNSYWTYTGNSIVNGAGVSDAGGNGLVYWRVSNGRSASNLVTADYLFVLRNSQIDYMVVQSGGSGAPTTQTWTYGWVVNPLTGSGFNAGDTGKSNYLTVPAGTNNSHDAIVSFDGRVYFCDGCNIQKFYQTSSTTLFDPTNAATFTGLNFNLLPIDDISQCLSPFGTNMLIGAEGSVAYQWDTTSNLVSNYIPIAEPFVSKIVTVNTNAYMFAGNRGRIYITNGSQADLWKKLPDHLSNTIEPKYRWGGATAVKNQLYFSFIVMDNANNVITSEGGLWAADLDTKALRITNKLSYGTYAGYATALIPQVYNPVNSNNPSGSSLFIGWQNGNSSSDSTLCGVDQPTSANGHISNSLYTAGQPYLISDLIPVGTFLKPITPSQVEFKLSAPLLTNESIQLLVASSLASGTNPTFTSVGTFAGNGTLVSGNSQSFPIQNIQWLLVKVISTSLTGSDAPSFNRLTELRIMEATQSRSSMSQFQVE